MRVYVCVAYWVYVYVQVGLAPLAFVSVCTTMGMWGQSGNVW